MRTLRDYHIHTAHGGCANETMSLEAIFKAAERQGLESIAITDHLNDRPALPIHEKIKQAIQRCGETPFELFFGAELNVIPGVELPYDEDIIRRLGFQFAIGGPHGTHLDDYDITKLVDRQHRLHLETVANPLIDVLVHPWWFGKKEFDDKGYPWFTDMSFVPETVTRELGAAAVEHGTAIEINAMAIFANDDYSEAFKRQYVDYLGLLASEGVTFATGSDAHDIGHLEHLGDLDAVVEQLGIDESRMYHPSRGKQARELA